uniref:IncC-like protein n=1 Tax=Rhizobium meliloti TaxID=382 RepID=Q5BTN9_RHIML|nr:IncC-like protein [Sinorhizobium meliloti]
MKTVTIANQKGGVGKTTLACHLAFHLRDLGRRVLFVDLDNQGNASSTLKSAASGCKATALFHDDHPALPEPREGITLIEADPSLTDLERQNPQVINAFRHNLQAISGNYDFAVIDTPPTLGLRMTAALIQSDYVVCPIELDSYSIQGITMMLQTIFGVRDKYNPKLSFLGMLPSRFNSHSPAAKANLSELLSSFAHFTIPAKLSNRSAIPEALGQGVPVWEIPKTAAREAGKELKGVLDQITAKMEAAA